MCDKGMSRKTGSKATARQTKPVLRPGHCVCDCLTLHKLIKQEREKEENADRMK